MKILGVIILLLSVNVYAGQISSLSGIQVNANGSAAIINAQVNLVWQNELVDEEYVMAAREAVVNALKQMKVREITDSYAVGVLKDEIKRAVNESKGTSGYKINEVYVTQLYVDTQSDYTERGAQQRLQLDKAMLALIKKLANQ